MMIEKIIEDGVLNPEDYFSFKSSVEERGKRLVCIDATFVFPGSDEDLYANFTACRVPDARFLDVMRVRDTSSHLPNMVPSLKVFTDEVQKIGIGEGDVLVLYGQNSITMGPARVWWLFRGFGHSDVVVLNGALPEWKCVIGEAESGAVNKAYDNTREALPLREFDQSFVADMALVQQISEGGSRKIVDARPAVRFSGEAKEPRDGMRSGHIPNSVNIPCSSLLDENGRLKDKGALKDILLGDDTNNTSVILSCGSGMTACALALAYYHIGIDDFKVYDGSWSEWGREDSPTRVATL